MTVAGAMAYVERLAILKFFPSGEAALIEIAEMLAELCKTDQEAERLVRVVRENFDEWPGPKTFRTMYLEALRDLQGPEEFKGFERPTDLCPRCHSWGFCTGSDGMAALCDLGCNATKDNPALLELMERQNASRRAKLQQAAVAEKAHAARPARITQADIDAALAGRKM